MQLLSLRHDAKSGRVEGLTSCHGFLIAADWMRAKLDCTCLAWPEVTQKVFQHNLRFQRRHTMFTRCRFWNTLHWQAVG